MVNFFKRKWKGCAGEDAKILESRRKCVEVLRHLQSLQSQRDELEAKFLQERAALEAKYQKFYEPLDTERYCIVNGVREIGGATNEVAADEQGATDARKGVSNFWVNAMKTLEVLAEEITERDEEALGYLKDIRWHRIENSKGFELEFIFAVNPFFKNDVLTKTYYMIDEDELILEKAIGTVIEWYPGKCLTLKKMAKEESKNANPITKSFFNFFSPPHVPEDDDDNVEDTTEEELQNRMGRDYEVGSTIRDKVIPYAVSLFTIEAAYEDEDDYDSDAYDSGTDEDEDEDEC